MNSISREKRTAANYEIPVTSLSKLGVLRSRALWATAFLTYLAGAALVGRHYTTSFRSQVSIGLLLGIAAFLPLFPAVLLLQLSIARLLGRAKACSERIRAVSAAVPPILLLAAAVAYSRLPPSVRVKDEAFARFFAPKPTSVSVTEYGYERTFFPGGTYVLVFTVPRSDLVALLQNRGYSPVAIDADPDQWRLSLCNIVVSGLTTGRVQINAASLCYSRDTPDTHSRIFYNDASRTAVLIGFGDYWKF